MAARHRGPALALLTSVQFVLVLDASIVNIALPPIGRDLHFDQADLSWVTNAHTLAFGGFLLFGGRVADLAGRRRMFLLGLALFTATSLVGGLALLVYTLVDADEAGWTSARTLGLGAGAVALLVAFVAVEARVRHPLVPLGVFRNRSLTGGDLAAVLMTMAIFPMFYVMTLYLQQVKGYEPVKAGLAQLPVAIAIGAGSAVGSRLVTRFGPRVPVGAALAVAAGGLAWFSRMSTTGHYAVEALGPAIVMGLGAGVVFVGVTIAATAGASADESGLASGLVNTAQQVGGALGLALVVAVAAHVTGNAFADGEHAAGAALNEGFRAGMLFAGGVALLAAAAALALIPGRTAAEPAPREAPAKVG
ncbi:MFS transporter [Actinomadura sp. LOL_016]|uniref:MFS transporter n=1 Tax=unclassified Actinomadura TaxID=2626254 RepID=UPI003A80FE6B